MYEVDSAYHIHDMSRYEVDIAVNRLQQAKICLAYHEILLSLALGKLTSTEQSEIVKLDNARKENIQASTRFL